MPVMTRQILKVMDFTKTQKSRYLENETLFFLQIKKSMTTLWQKKKKKNAAEVTFEIKYSMINLLLR